MGGKNIKVTDTWKESIIEKAAPLINKSVFYLFIVSILDMKD